MEKNKKKKNVPFFTPLLLYPRKLDLPQRVRVTKKNLGNSSFGIEKTKVGERERAGGKEEKRKRRTQAVIILSATRRRADESTSREPLERPVFSLTTMIMLCLHGSVTRPGLLVPFPRNNKCGRIVTRHATLTRAIRPQLSSMTRELVKP